MSKTSLHQRKKKERENSSSSSADSKRVQALEEEINKALQTVQITKFRTQELQTQWRTHLLRMSYLVVLLAMHQCSTPVTECIKELKLIDNSAASNVSGLTFMGVIFGDSAVEFMNLFISIALFRFLCVRNPPGTFSNLSYCCSSSMIMLCLGMFFHSYQKTQKAQEEEEGPIVGSNRGCIESLASWTGEEKFMSYSVGDGEDAFERSARQFPISCVFHVIVTVCYFVMKMGMDQCDGNVEAMEKLQRELIESKKKNTISKKSK
mmetsp:Transcript_21959/g.32888  ORF Transcript_21959/g.32888 Transcript_21959/m.32888 type:complete len:264 (+) Transcript_21959:29-820(+)